MTVLSSPGIARNNTKSKSAIFLLELVIAIMFLAVSSAICVRLFVTAHSLSRKTSDLNMAVLKAQSVAEIFKSTSGGERFAEALGASGDESSFEIFYDNNWNETGAENQSEAAYRLACNVDAVHALKIADIAVCYNNADETIFSITVKKYDREGAAS